MEAATNDEGGHDQSHAADKPEDAFLYTSSSFDSQLLNFSQRDETKETVERETTAVYEKAAENIDGEMSIDEDLLLAGEWTTIPEKRRGNDSSKRPSSTTEKNNPGKKAKKRGKSKEKGIGEDLTAPNL